MLVALLSDIHDHTTHLLLALQAAKERGCTHLLFMGDMASASTFCLLREEWPHPLDLVFGNNEYELQTFERMASQWPHTTLHGDLADITLGERRLFFCHLPRDAGRAVRSGKYDAVFFGHTHQAEVCTSGHTLIANPGEVYGRREAPGFAVYNTETNTVQLISL